MTLVTVREHIGGIEAGEVPWDHVHDALQRQEDSLALARRRVGAATTEREAESWQKDVAAKERVRDRIWNLLYPPHHPGVVVGPTYEPTTLDVGESFCTFPGCLAVLTSRHEKRLQHGRCRDHYRKAHT